MKVFLIVLLSTLLILSGCRSESLPETTYSYQNRLIYLNALSVCESNNTYHVIVTSEEDIGAKAVFSAIRELVACYGLTPVADVDCEQYFDVRLSDIEDLLGPNHVDIGSGFSIPAYVTENAYLIYFDLDNDTVSGVTKLDLISGRTERHTKLNNTEPMS